MITKENFRYLIVASHRRSGTHLVIDSIFNNFSSVAHGYINLDRLLPESSQKLSVERFQKKIKSKKIRILKTHSFGDFSHFDKCKVASDFLKEEIIPFSKVIYVSRDGRDVLNSLYYYMIAKGVNYSSFSKFLRSRNSSDQVYTDLSKVEFLREHKKSWIGVENTISVSYEDMCTDFIKTMSRIENFLGLEIVKAPEKITLKKYSKISRGVRRLFPSFFNSTAILPRSGGSGGWEKNFSDEDFEYYSSVIKGVL
ncbi:MAG: sulfotransferase domain-containing protein [Candidatus Aminicenantes bacterium]|nr:sulfotransferase domain-containing protein [Candidatus Aminicenantes bacterium]MCK5003477.1 sulfotransferase domain-containing protein [Candidatus Aminicenantes bacterium]